ncbi:hypothetical protein C1752_12050 [Acaryochloris thomasi RCC1774]|uniref:Uncharacterized protein n=1 Tax=Acaryochloris thomasi RCC1774 TaxID=1764569 RepID=A0A2W1J7P0_9CYAN|nr:hypothetical protein [Acaryochloris thomasi]PZD70479.1 hypothetical protein C1752_12050 [Acaryochloris thomasi RCC1774]
MNLQKLKKVLKLSYGRLWLGLLLGGFVLESSCDRFYGGRVMVGLGGCDLISNT